MIFYLMGKSASGKDHIYQAVLTDTVLKDKLQPLVICTTRPMRHGEKNGREYWFTDEKTLQRLRSEEKVIEERCYRTVSGPWYYFTADDGHIDAAGQNYLGIGTLESYVRLKQYFGEQNLVPLLIESDDGIRLERALRRERKQAVPQYEEMCRRFLADAADFSEEKIAQAGIRRRFLNNGALDDCIREVAVFIADMI